MRTALTTANAGAVAPVTSVNALMATMVRFTSTLSSGSSDYLRMDTSGAWSFGTAETPVEHDDEWLLDPRAIWHGYESFYPRPDPQAIPPYCQIFMAPYNQPCPSNTIVHLPKGGEVKKSLQVEFVAVPGSHEYIDGARVRYQSSAISKTIPLEALLTAMGDKALQAMSNGTDEFVPVVSFGSEKRKQRGSNKSYQVPVFSVVRWESFSEVFGDSPDVAREQIFRANEAEGAPTVKEHEYAPAIDVTVTEQEPEVLEAPKPAKRSKANSAPAPEPIPADIEDAKYDDGSAWAMDDDDGDEYGDAVEDDGDEHGEDTPIVDPTPTPAPRARAARSAPAEASAPAPRPRAARSAPAENPAAGGNTRGAVVRARRSR